MLSEFGLIGRRPGRQTVRHDWQHSLFGGRMFKTDGRHSRSNNSRGHFAGQEWRRFFVLLGRIERMSVLSRCRRQAGFQNAKGIVLLVT